MAVNDLFFKRQKRLRGEYPDVYQYDYVPPAFRHQAIHILKDVTEALHPLAVGDCYRAIHDVFCRELGILALPYTMQGVHDWEATIHNYLATEEDTELVLSLVELAVTATAAVVLKDTRRNAENAKHRTEAAITELNARFRENGLGYQLESGRLIRMDSQFVHADVVKPVLQLLAEARFAGPQSEFLDAHRHYRHGDYAATLNECLKAFESTIKVICAGREDWTPPDRATAQQLVDVVLTKGLIPAYSNSQFTSLRSLLESGVPTLRNRESGHGTGATPKVIPEYIASYTLHLTATSILFLARADEQLPR